MTTALAARVCVSFVRAELAEPTFGESNRLARGVDDSCFSMWSFIILEIKLLKTKEATLERRDE